MPKLPVFSDDRAAVLCARGERIRSVDIALAHCLGEDDLIGPADMSAFDPEEVLELRQRLFRVVGRG